MVLLQGSHCSIPQHKEVLGRVLGPARGAGNEMAQWILKANGRVVPRRSLRPLKVDEIHSPVEIKKREVFDELIKRRWGTPMTPPNTQQPKAFEKYDDHEQKEQPTLEVEDIVDSTGKLINQQPALINHNLLPPFMLREAGIQINDVPKIHVTSPSEEHHAIIFQETNFRIPLTLHGTFSYFPTSKPTTQELEEPEDVYGLTPTTWNPHLMPMSSMKNQCLIGRET